MPVYIENPTEQSHSSDPKGRATHRGRMALKATGAAMGIGALVPVLAFVQDHSPGRTTLNHEIEDGQVPSPVAPAHTEAPKHEAPEQTMTYTTKGGDTDWSVAAQAYPHEDPRLAEKKIDAAADKAVGYDLPIGDLPTDTNLVLGPDAQIGSPAPSPTDTHVGPSAR